MADALTLLTRAAGEVSCASMTEGACSGSDEAPGADDAATGPLRRAPRATSPALRVRSVDVVTFGCRLNAYESDKIAAPGAADGVTDAVVFNTCAVTAEAVRQARQAIRKARRERPGAHLVVTGCAAQIDPAASPPCPRSTWCSATPRRPRPARSRSRVGKSATSSRRDPPPPRGEGSGVGGSRRRTRRPNGWLICESPPPLTPPLEGEGKRARAYVEVQNGCDHRCTFCIIPFGRGNSRSVPAARVVDEVRSLARAGYAEVVLTGVDLTSWGAELAGRAAAGRPGGADPRRGSGAAAPRLSSIDAAEIDAALMARLASETRLCPHLHLSLQSGDDLILKRMKRRHSSADALSLIAAVRRARPDVAFGADFIAGFPTETEAAFENTLAFVETAGLAWLHVFPFSPRPGTPAARMPQVARDVVKDRAARLRAAGDAALGRHLDRQVGRTVEALVEREGRARAADFTEIAFTGAAPIGAIAPMRLAGHDGRRALGVPA